MMNKPWFKLFIWVLTTFFFFISSSVIISMFKPGPSETEVMSFMMGMMKAMDSSLMGVAMNLEEGGTLSTIILLSGMMLVPVIAFSVIIGLFIRIRQSKTSSR